MTDTPTEIVIHTPAEKASAWAWLALNGGYTVYLGPDGKLHALPLNV
ncbi:hypothetical protein [uncultured Microbacterium sp.]|nr:hypothetical protein [uncultured Microbacterium sp.]